MGKIVTALKIARDQGLLTLLDRSVARLRGNTYVWTGQRYGLREALLFPDGFHVDLWTRYSRTTNILMQQLTGEQKRRWRILEIGSGGAGISGFMRDGDFWARADLVVLDHDPHLIAGVKRASPVQGNAARLPFTDKSFDAVLAVDILEHLPTDVRRLVAQEVRRVARRLVVCHCPVQGPEEGFEGGSCDMQFERAYRLHYQRQPPDWVTEHLRTGHPTPGELRELFPGCTLSGDQNCEVWLDYMLAGEPSSGGFTRFFTGYRYWRRWSRHDNVPPFRSALTVWNAPD